MRTIGVIVVAAVWVGAPLSARAGDRDKALAVIEQAIKAHGGAEALAKAQTRTRSGEGVIALGGDLPFTTEETIRFPDCCRVSLDVARTRILIVLNGDKGWMQTGGTTQQMNPATFTERNEELYVWWLTTLTPLLKREFVLEPSPDAKVEDADAAVIKATSKGYPEATLFFDKKTGLLLKIARRATEAGVPVHKEYLYSDYKEQDGVKLPGKETTMILVGAASSQKAKKLSEVKYSNYKLLPRIEDSTFGKP